MKNNIDFKKIDQLLKDKKMTYKDLAAAMGRVEEHDYVSKCNEMGIDEHSRKFAIEKIDAYTQTLGYGKNAKRVIFRRTRQ